MKPSCTCTYVYTIHRQNTATGTLPPWQPHDEDVYALGMLACASPRVMDHVTVEGRGLGRGTVI